MSSTLGSPARPGVGSTTTTTTTSTASSSSSAVSYEKFAPRSTIQIDRLNRIAALTAGPTGRYTSNENNNNNGTSSGDPLLTTSLSNYNNNTKNIWKDAMIASTLYDVVPKSIITTNNIVVSVSKDDGTTIDTNVVVDTIEQSTKLIYQLTDQLKYTTSLRLAVRASINITEDISNRHAELIRHSGELSAAADRLQEEEAILSRHAEEIGMPLQHYDAIDRISLLVGVLFKGKSIVRGLAKTKVDNDEFPLLLNEIDKAIEYFGMECGGKLALKEYEKLQQDNKNNSSKNTTTTANKKINEAAQQQQLHSGSIEYYRRSLALQEAALDLIKEAVAERITNTTTQIIAAVSASNKNSKGFKRNSSSSTGSGIIVPADQLEASLIYTRFHGISSRSNRLLSLLRSKVNTTTSSSTSTTTSAIVGSGDHIEAYTELYKFCRTTYCTARETLLRPTVRYHLEQLKEQHGPVGMTRLASVFLIRLCTVETSLYNDFFGDTNITTSSSTTSTTTGTKTADKKSTNTSSRLLGIGDDAGTSAAATAYRKDADYQAYLTSLCSELHRTVRQSLVKMVDLDLLCQVVSILREERSLASSSPTTIAAARAISSVIQDAQERLIFIATSTLTKDVIKFKPTTEDLNYPDKLIKKVPVPPTDDPASSDAPKEVVVVDDDDAVTRQLQEMYDSWFPPMRTVLRILSKIFRVVEGKVFEDMALQSVQSCTRCLKDAAQYIHSHKGQMHSDLFLVKHLLILREQLSPFDIELRSVERQLDFSTAGKAVARFLANRNRRLFSMSTENALLTLLREGVTVQESSVDSKRDLEDALRTACNDFIEHTSTMVASDVLALAELYKQSDAISLGQNTAKLQADYVLPILIRTSESLPQTLSEITKQMTLYLDNPATQNILLKPVNRKIIRAIEEIRNVVTTIINNTSSTMHGWDDEEKSTKFMEVMDLLEKSVKKSTKVSTT